MKAFDIITNWLAGNYNWIIGTSITVLLFVLSRQLSKRDRIEHREIIKRKAEKLKLGQEVYLVNTKRYFKDYPLNKEGLLSGYSHIRAEIKATRFNGVEFFCGIKGALEKPSGVLVFNNESKNDKQEEIKIFEAGLVPYEWIEYIDLRGDEYGYKPLIFCYFKGKRYWKKSLKKFLPSGYPYRKIIYYRKSEVYRNGDPADMEFCRINKPISIKDK